MSLFSSDSIILHITSARFFPWDTISWTVELAVLNPIKIDGITVKLTGINKREQISFTTNSYSKQTSRQSFFNQWLKILGPGTYSSQVIPFSYNIPEYILPKRFGWIEKIGNLPEWLVSIINLIIQLMGIQNNQIIPEFTFSASADIPWGLDLTASSLIYINQKETAPINIPAPAPAHAPAHAPAPVESGI